MASFSQTEAPLKLPDIKEIENFIGLIFPTEYVKHLLKYNGGQCFPNIFTFNENGANATSSIDWFLAIYDGEYDSLKKEIEMLKIERKRMPLHMLPIAHDSIGNLICISCGTINNGYIYLWDHENEVDYDIADDNNYSNLYFISKGFNEFIDGLK